VAEAAAASVSVGVGLIMVGDTVAGGGDVRDGPTGAAGVTGWQAATQMARTQKVTSSCRILIS
jgi:hypothetical protein